MTRPQASSTAFSATIQSEAKRIMATQSHPEPEPPPAPEPEWIALVRQKVESLRYGVVQIVVHDGRVTQIERNEKTRLANGRDAQAEE